MNLAAPSGVKSLSSDRSTSSDVGRTVEVSTDRWGRVFFGSGIILALSM